MWLYKRATIENTCKLLYLILRKFIICYHHTRLIPLLSNVRIGYAFCFCWTRYFSTQLSKKNGCRKMILKGELRPKIQPCFFGIILMILWKKNLEQSFVVFWSVLTKLWSYKVCNPAWVPSYPWMYSLLVFFAYFCQFYGKRTFYTVLW